MHPIVFDHVWKRYRLGSQHDSLRDAIPALLKRWVSRNGQGLEPDEFWAIKDVSFEVRKGETLGVIGPNGAGKSTVLKLLSRISKQTKGELRVRGRLAALIEIGAGFHQDLTGRENIYLNGTILGLRRREIDRLFDSIVAFSELEQFLDMPVKRYSSGMVVRLGFAVAAHIDPEVLLIDEVLAVGDLAFQQKCMQRILELKDKQTTMIFVSHNLEAVQRICDRCLLLNGGEIIREGHPADVVGYYRDEMLRKGRVKAKAWSSKGVSVLTDGIEHLEATIHGENGQSREEFESGEPLCVQLRYVTRRPIQGPSLTVAIQRLDGLLCHEASSRLAGLSWQAWQGEGLLSLTYPRLHLGPNAYQISVTLYEGHNPVPVARLRNQLFFRVTSKHRSRGVVQLEYTWTSDQSDHVNALSG